MPVTARVAALQLPAHDVEEFTAAWPAILDRIAAAAAAGARMIVLPEGTIPGYVLTDRRYDERLTGQALERLQQLARDRSVVIVCGVARMHDQVRFNSAAVIDSDGSLAGFADKTFLWHFDRRWFEPAERIAPIVTSIGPLGVLICADGRIPTIARALVDAGAQILVMPTAWVSSGRNPGSLENVQADLLAHVRARENRVPFVAANKCGTERGYVAYCGKSQIVAADGSVVAIASQDAPETIQASLELGAPPPHRAAPLSTSERTPTTRSLRVAISSLAAPPGVNEICETLEADVLLTPGGDDRFEQLAALAPTERVTDSHVQDPAGLVGLRTAGVQIVVWRPVAGDPPWNERLARARALELRIFFIVLDRERAYAIDPDGTILAGTFGAYRIASCTLDLRRTQQTQVAPGTDIVAGLDRVRALLTRKELRPH